MSSVNPDIRQKAAANLLRDYGYFNGTVSYKTFPNPKDSLKAKIQYTVDMRNPYFIDTVYYHGFSKRTFANHEYEPPPFAHQSGRTV